jgi:hypothetical protein
MTLKSRRTGELLDCAGKRSDDGAFERTNRVEFSSRFVRAKAVSRRTCHRSPKCLLQAKASIKWRNSSSTSDASRSVC